MLYLFALQSELCKQFVLALSCKRIRGSGQGHPTNKYSVSTTSKCSRLAPFAILILLHLFSTTTLHHTRTTSNKGTSTSRRSKIHYCCILCKAKVTTAAIRQYENDSIKIATMILAEIFRHLVLCKRNKMEKLISFDAVAMRFVLPCVCACAIPNATLEWNCLSAYIHSRAGGMRVPATS